MPPRSLRARYSTVIATENKANRDSTSNPNIASDTITVLDAIPKADRAPTRKSNSNKATAPSNPGRVKSAPTNSNGRKASSKQSKTPRVIEEEEDDIEDDNVGVEEDGGGEDLEEGKEQKSTEQNKGVTSRGRTALRTTAPAKRKASQPQKQPAKKAKTNRAKHMEKEIAETQYAPLDIDIEVESTIMTDQQSQLEENLVLTDATSGKDLQLAKARETRLKKPPVKAAKPSKASKTSASEVMRDGPAAFSNGSSSAMAAEDVSVDELAVPLAPPLSLAAVHPDATVADLRKLLTTMTKNYERAKSDFQELLETGVKTAQKNLDETRSAFEADIKTKNALIKSLEAEISGDKKTVSAITVLQKQHSDTQKENEKLKADLITKNKVIEENGREIERLQTRITALRNSATSSQQPTGNLNLNIPGSVVRSKSTGPISGKGKPGHGENDDQTVAQLKYDLFGDLTGLMILSVLDGNHPEFDEEVPSKIYDCAQTGRNGTLRFKLVIPETQKNGAYSDHDEITFLPCFDPKNDQRVIELLPSYLRNSISFNRLNAAKFYHRVLKYMDMQATADGGIEKTSAQNEAEHGSGDEV